MTGVLFLMFLLFIVSVVGALTANYLSRRTAAWVLASLFVWLLYVGVLASFGVIRNVALRPPGIAFIVVPELLLVFFLFVRSAEGARIALAFPLWVVLGMQSFRAGVELFLHQLWIEGLVPKMLTYQGANVDILIGISAPIMAWLFTRQRLGIGPMLLWNVMGLMTLANVVIRSALTAPGPLRMIHAEVSNTAIAIFPFTYIPGFFVPLAVVLHVLAIRALRSKQVAAQPRTSSVQHEVVL